MRPRWDEPGAKPFEDLVDWAREFADALQSGAIQDGPVYIKVGPSVMAVLAKYPGGVPALQALFLEQTGRELVFL